MNRMPSIAQLTRRSLPALTPAERRVARTLLAAYPIAGLEPVSQLAGRAAVSAPTVLRFVGKLGFAGYPGFQRTLREELHLRVTSPRARYRAEADGASRGGALRSAFDTLITSLSRTADELSPGDFEAATALLADSDRRISSVGGRISHVLALHLSNQLRQLRPDVHLLPRDPASLMERAVDLNRRDVVIAFDYRRYQDDTIRFVRSAARQGAVVILVTDPLLSPAAGIARHVLTFRPEAPPPFDSPIAGFAIIEVLISAVAARLGPLGLERIGRIEEISGGWMWDEAREQ